MEQKRKRDQRTKNVCGTCNYCMQNVAYHLVKITKGPNASYRRWMCGLCIFKRQRHGVSKIEKRSDGYARAN